MKYIQSIFILLTLTFCIGFVVSSCIESHTKGEDHQSTLAAAKEEFEGDTDAFIEDIKQFRADLSVKYEHNKRIIDSLRENKTQMMKASYRDKVEELEIANEIIKNKIDTIAVKGNLEWKNFKKELNQDEENLEDTFKELKVKI